MTPLTNSEPCLLDLMRDAGKDSGVKWKHNALRHSFISFRGWSKVLVEISQPRLDRRAIVVVGAQKGGEGHVGLSDLLDGLLAMTGDNWGEKCEELAELLRPHVER